MKKLGIALIILSLGNASWAGLSGNTPLLPTGCMYGAMAIDDLPVGCSNASDKIICAHGTYINCTSCEIDYTLSTANFNPEDGNDTYSTCIFAPTLCEAGKYKDNGTCKDCPPPGTSRRGSDAITDCYTDATTTLFSDSIGSGRKITEKCYYTN